MNSKIVMAAVLPAGLLLSACNAADGDADETMEAPAEEVMEAPADMDAMATDDAAADAAAEGEDGPDDRTGDDERMTAE